MAMQSQGLRQVQKQTQSLVLAPQLRQSLKILQVPALELRSAILEELQTNPLLEELGNNDESLDANEVEASPDEIESEKTDEFPKIPPTNRKPKRKKPMQIRNPMQVTIFRI
jgi:RNA polymerase sigma-54 factor